MGKLTDIREPVYGAEADEVRDRLRRSAPAPAYGAWKTHIRRCPVCTGEVSGTCTTEARLWSATRGGAR